MIPHRPLRRVPPRLPTQAYKTYSLRSPLSTHFRKATCEEVNCIAFNQGWRIALAGLDAALEYAARHSRKSFIEQDGFLWFEAGQSCFLADSHVISLERPEFYLVGRGDWRSFAPRQAKQHTRPTDWVDDMATHLDGIRKTIERG